MVDEARLVAHPVAVDHHAAVQVQTVVAAVGEVLLHHAAPGTQRERFSLMKEERKEEEGGGASPELLLANHLSQVFDDELSRAERLLGADAPALPLGPEPLQTLDPLVSLNVLVITLVSTRTRAGRTFCIAHPGTKQSG